MKNFKRLMAVVLTVMMLSTVAFAAAPSGYNKLNYAVSVAPASITQGATEFEFDIIFEDITGESVDFVDGMSADSQIGMTLTDAAIDAGIEITNITSEIVTINEPDTDGTYFWASLSSDSTVSLNADTVLCTITCTIPANVELGTYKVLAGNAYDFAELIDAAGESTSVIKWSDELAIVTVEAAAQKTPAAVTGGTAEFKSFTGSTGTVYTNVWVNKYTAKANDETIKAVKLAFNGKTVTVSDVEIEAGGTAEFDVAIVGAALNATVTPSVEVK